MSRRNPPKEDLNTYRIAIDANDPWRGSKSPLVTIVEFGDFQCPYCKRVEPTLIQLLDEYGEDLRLVWKDNPLSFHSQAKPAAALARTIFEKLGNEAFWEAHDALFQKGQELDEGTLREVYASTGLATTGGFESATSARPLEGRPTESIEQAFDFNARGTPSFFINGRRVKGAQPIGEFRKVIDAKLAEAKGYLAEGIPRSEIYARAIKDGVGPVPLPRRSVPLPQGRRPTLGDPKAKIVAQVFIDLECPFSARVWPTVLDFAEAHKTEVRVLIRPFPLPFHEHAHLAAQAAREVFLQAGTDAYVDYVTTVFERLDNKQPRDLEGLLQAASELAIDQNAFRQALVERKHALYVDSELRAAKESKITGTPFTVVGDAFVSGAQPRLVFERALKAARRE